MGQHLPDQSNGGEERQLEGRLPLGVRQLVERAGGRASGVVHQDVYPPEGVSRGPHHPPDIVEPCQIGGDREDLRVGLLPNFRGGSSEVRLRARADRHTRALRGQAHGAGLPHPLGRPGHERYFPHESQIHRSLPAVICKTRLDRRR